MILGAIFVLLYTLLGGFLAESASDFLQAIVMIVALILIIVAGSNAAGGFGAVIAVSYTHLNQAALGIRSSGSAGSDRPDHLLWRVSLHRSGHCSDFCGLWCTEENH